MSGDVAPVSACDCDAQNWPDAKGHEVLCPAAPAEATGLRERIEGAVEDALAGAATWQPGGWWLSLYAARKVSRRAIRAALAEATDGETDD